MNVDPNNRTSADPHAGKNAWGTPFDFFAMLDEEFCFGIDAAANRHNAKCLTWFGPGSPFGEDGLEADWHSDTVFINPPYGKGLLEPWLVKATIEREHGCVVVMLLPVNPDTGWWQHYVHGTADEVRFVERRIRFLKEDGTPGDSPMFASCVVVWYPRGHREAAPPRYIYQRYP